MNPPGRLIDAVYPSGTASNSKLVSVYNLWAATTIGRPRRYTGRWAWRIEVGTTAGWLEGTSTPGPVRRTDRVVRAVGLYYNARRGRICSCRTRQGEWVVGHSHTHRSDGLCAAARCRCERAHGECGSGENDKQNSLRLHGCSISIRDEKRIAVPLAQ